MSAAKAKVDLILTGDPGFQKYDLAIRRIGAAEFLARCNREQSV